ncbi:hypothetical protein C8J57DRAFT_1231007 [Mycena rebaudengoi]|nr:hypothetical protein C8J57DRAFT_1231007 [Mycena rebaudengoi]
MTKNEKKKINQARQITRIRSGNIITCGVSEHVLAPDTQKNNYYGHRIDWITYLTLPPRPNLRHPNWRVLEARHGTECQLNVYTYLGRSPSPRFGALLHGGVVQLRHVGAEGAIEECIHAEEGVQRPSARGQQREAAQGLGKSVSSREGNSEAGGREVLHKKVLYPNPGGIWRMWRQIIRSDQIRQTPPQPPDTKHFPDAILFPSTVKRLCRLMW